MDVILYINAFTHLCETIPDYQQEWDRSTSTCPEILHNMIRRL